MFGHFCWRQAVAVVQRQERVLLEAAPLMLGAFGKKEDREQHCKHEADEDGDGEDFHIWGERLRPANSGGLWE